VTLNLNQYEAKVVLALILNPVPQTVKDISQASTVPIQRTYDTLQRLKERGIIIQTATAPKTYTAKNLESLLKKRLIEERIRLNEWQRKEAERINEEKRKRLDYLKKESDDLIEITRALRRRPMAEPTKIAVQIEGWDNIQELLIQLLEEAKLSFWGVSRPPDWRDLTTLGAIQPRSLSEWYEAIDARNVDVRWLTSLSAFPSYIGYVQATYLPRRFIDDGKIFEKYVVVDGEKVLINLRDPVTGTYGATAVLIESVSVARIFGDYFETLWAEAVPAEEMVRDFEEDVEAICQELRKRGFTDLDVRVYKSLLRMGASSVKSIRFDLKWMDKQDTPSLKVVGKVLKKLVQRGIVERHRALNLYMPKNPKTLLQIT
jgi:sugar-specific transcriptional regulator TrmB